MNYKINFENYKENFSIPSVIISDNFNEINGDYLKVILLIFKNPDREYSVNLLSKLLGLSEATTKDAIDYWISVNVLLDDKNIKKTIKPTIVSGDKFKVQDNKMVDSELKFLFDNSQKVLSRNMTSTDIRILKRIYHEYSLPVDVILMVIAYCVKIGKDSIKYIENECLAWYNNGVNSSAKAEEYLLYKERQSVFERQVREIFKISDVQFKANEQMCIDKWYNKFKYSKDIVALAYERALNYVLRPSIPYTNTILANWNQKGLRTVDEIIESENINTQSKNNMSQDNIKNNTSSFDIDEYEKQLRQTPKLD